MLKPRLGSIEFINSLPVELGFLSRKIPMDAEISTGSPSYLNEAMLSGRLDLSPVSVLWVAEHAADFLILPELSISSESSVDSVLLFSRRPMAELKNHRIDITAKGRTTPVLLQILCRERYGFTPLLEILTGDVEDVDAVLLIGDEALIYKESLSRIAFHTVVTDLAQEWRSWTGLPFVFALWAVRRSYFLTNAECVHEIHENILKSKEWGLDHWERVLDESARRTGLSEEALTRYFTKLSFDFDDNLKKGLTRYLEFAHKLGFLKSVPALEELPVIERSREAVIKREHS